MASCELNVLTFNLLLILIRGQNYNLHTIPNLLYFLLCVFVIKLEIMKVFEKLKKKIKEDLGCDVTDLTRTYAGSCQKGGGAFVWYGKINGNEIGSTVSATKLLKKEKLIEIPNPTIIGFIEIF